MHVQLALSNVFILANYFQAIHYIATTIPMVVIGNILISVYSFS